MSKNKTIFVLGILIAVLPVMDGFPRSWRETFTVIMGLLISAIVFWDYKQKKVLSSKKFQPKGVSFASPEAEAGLGSGSLSDLRESQVFKDKPDSL